MRDERGYRPFSAAPGCDAALATVPGVRRPSWPRPRRPATRPGTDVVRAPGRRAGATTPPRAIALITRTKAIAPAPGPRHEPYVYKTRGGTLTFCTVPPRGTWLHGDLPRGRDSATAPTARACTPRPTSAAPMPPAARPPRRPPPGCPPPAPRPPPGWPGCASRRCRARPARPRARAATASSAASPMTTVRSGVHRPSSAARWRTMCSALLPPDGPVRPSTRTKCALDAVRPHQRDELVVRRHASTATGCARPTASRRAAPRRPRSSPQPTRCSAVVPVEGLVHDLPLRVGGQPPHQPLVELRHRHAVQLPVPLQGDRRQPELGERGVRRPDDASMSWSSVPFQSQTMCAPVVLPHARNRTRPH